MLERIYLGIFADSDPPPRFSYAPVVAPGLVRAFVYAQPELVSLLTNEHVQRHGADRLYEAGLRNLERELAFEVSSQDGVFQLDGSMFTAATVFLLPEVVARTTGESTLPDGVLVSFPLQTTLLYHVPGTDDWDNALRTMFDRTRARFEDGPDPDVLSPYLYWWRAGELTQITGDSDNDELKVYVSGEFEKVVQRFAG